MNIKNINGLINDKEIEKIVNIDNYKFDFKNFKALFKNENFIYFLNNNAAFRFLISSNCSLVKGPLSSSYLGHASLSGTHS